MNFAPYQSSPPESTRALSPSRSPSGAQQGPKGSYFPSIADTSDPWAASRPQRLPSPSAFATPPITERQVEAGGPGEVFETSLGLRMDWEAPLAYLVLPPAGGVVLLLFEHKSDYVRFHAWQSALVFAAMFVLHVVLSWSSVLSWMLFVVDLGLIGWCAWHAYKDAETLDRLELPFFGRIASRFVDSE